MRKQDSYLFPVINDFKDKEVWLSGHSRCDSPGHNAKYGTYTMIDQHNNKIVDFQIVQVSEVTSSNAMERKGFKRCMENIQGKGAKVKVVATDRHVSIKADMKCIYPDVDHQFDVWHLAKSVTEKQTEKVKKKDCGVLFNWIKSVSNISGCVLTHAMGTRNPYGRSGYQLSTPLPTSTTGTAQIAIMNVPTHPSPEMWPEPRDG